MNTVKVLLVSLVLVFGLTLAPSMVSADGGALGGALAGESGGGSQESGWCNFLVWQFDNADSLNTAAYGYTADGYRGLLLNYMAASGCAW